MPSTYSTRLRLENIANGEQSGSWGDTTDNNICTLIEEAITGVAQVVMGSDANYTLTTNNATSDEARCPILSVTSSVSLTATRDVIVPTVYKHYLVYNGTTGSQSIRVKTSGGTGITIPNGYKMMVYCDGTNVVDSVNALPSGTTIGGAAVVVGGANTSITSVYLNNTGLKIKDTDASHGLSIVPGSNITADRVFTLTTGDAARTLNISAADVTISSFAATILDDANAGAVLTTIGGAASATTISSGGALSGGGDLSANRTITLDVSAASADSAPDPNADFVLSYDTSAAGHKKVLHKNVKPTEHWMIAVSDETTALTTGTAKVTFRAPYAFTVTAVRASVNTVSSSGNPTFDINESGVSILSTTLSIDANEKTSTTAATAAVISDASIADDAEITIDIDTAGTGAKGAKVCIIGYRT